MATIIRHPLTSYRSYRLRVVCAHRSAAESERRAMYARMGLVCIPD